ncbi:MAG: magnesium chelatase subunit H [Myxococcota bacterium]
MRRHTTGSEQLRTPESDRPQDRVLGPIRAPLNFVIITLDRHIAGAVDAARVELQDDLPDVVLKLHAASEWDDDPERLRACQHDIETGDVIFVNMLFMEPHIKPVLPHLLARREACDAMVACMSAGEVIKLTRMGGFRMDGPQKGPMALLKRLRGSKSKNGSAVSGAKQMAMLRRLPKILRFIPGTAQDVRAYFLTLQYWLAGSTGNIANMVRFLVNRYADGDRRPIRGHVKAQAPLEYPELGVYHPRIPRRITTDVEDVPVPETCPTRLHPRTVGLLVMRSYILSGDTAHYDAVIEALEGKGIRVIAAFASGLDARPAVEAFFQKDGKPTIDALVSLTGFSLVGGPAFNDSRAAEEMLATLDVPYLSAQAIEFQSIDQWQDSARGLLPVESTIMLAIPELDGATGPIVFAGRPATDADGPRRMTPILDRVAMLASRVDRWMELRQTDRRNRKVAVVVFNFPPNGGAVGTAAFLSVFESLFETLKRLKEEGYAVELPDSVEHLRRILLEGNATRYGTDAHVCGLVGVDDYVRSEPYLSEIEAQWGPAPGKSLTDGQHLFVLGAHFGNVMVGLQPPFGYEGDPMRLLFESGFTPTHAFSAFYRYLRQDFGANAILHFGTHGALEFMPGKQAGLSGECWPDRLISELPNLYLYAANNPSEGTIAKRRSAATLVSYMTPPVAEAGLYTDLLTLRESVDRWRQLPPDDHAERSRLESLIQAQAAQVEMAPLEPSWSNPAEDIRVLREKLDEVERTLIPDGLHVVGQPAPAEARTRLLAAIAENTLDVPMEPEILEAIGAGESLQVVLQRLGDDPKKAEAVTRLVEIHGYLCADHELDALVRALDGRFIRPAPGGDILRTPTVLPTGRNLHGFDPFRIPSAFAVKDGALQARRLLERHLEDGNGLPESVALVLWGTDNLKTGGVPIGQVLALFGARPRFDAYGRLAGAELIPLEELGRPRVDVVVTLSGIFRDLLPLQTRLLAEAAHLAASADEPLEMNFVRRNALRYQEMHGVDLETAALRVFSNADGTYGSNVNMLVDSGAWNDEDELAEAFTRRKCFAYGLSGRPQAQAGLMASALADVQLTYQNLESVELGVTTIDHYFDTLGGIGRAIQRVRGSSVPVYIGDQTRGEGLVRTLSEQVILESRTRTLNPTWYEGMLRHGSEGVRQIEAHITNTMGWSATTGQVAPWVYNQLSQTYVLDPEMRKRMAELNPKASAKLALRLLEAHERDYWTPDSETLEALRRAGEELEDRLEGLDDSVAA